MCANLIGETHGASIDLRSNAMLSGARDTA
jgi:hypothetical protein